MNKKYLDAREFQKTQQQGLGHPIISFLNGKKRTVYVGKDKYQIDNGRTFHEFLHEYLYARFGEEWWVEKETDPLNPHPMRTWCKKTAELILNQEPPYFTTMTNAGYGFLSMAYNLYLIHHNTGEIPRTLVGRLKIKKEFHGAQYESVVIGEFIKAGFRIQLPDQNVSNSQPDCYATHPHTGKEFFVEAKAIHIKGIKGATDGEPDKAVEIKIRRILRKALRKNTLLKMVIFIDVNLPGGAVGEIPDWVKPSLERILEEETKEILNKEIPEAYIFLTNFPPHNQLDDVAGTRYILPTGYKINDFGYNTKCNVSPIEMYHAEKAHKEMYDLYTSMKERPNIPATFNGEIPEFEYLNIKNRLVVGQKYCFPLTDGQEVVGELIRGDVDEQRGVATLIMQRDGNNYLFRCPLTADEVNAYIAHPNTFFGIIQPKKTPEGDCYETFKTCLRTHKNTRKEKLLAWMEKDPQIERLSQLPQQRLAEIYCERHVQSIKSRKTALLQIR
jgi:hypothetical protein